MLRLATVGPYGRLAHLPLYVVADARGLGDDEVDLVKQIWKARVLVIHTQVMCKINADKRRPSRRNVHFTECSIANSIELRRGPTVSATHSNTWVNAAIGGILDTAPRRLTAPPSEHRIERFLRAAGLEPLQVRLSYAEATHCEWRRGGGSFNLRVYVNIVDCETKQTHIEHEDIREVFSTHCNASKPSPMPLAI
jgi:hypothetical protein